MATLQCILHCGIHIPWCKIHRGMMTQQCMIHRGMMTWQCMIHPGMMTPCPGVSYTSEFHSKNQNNLGGVRYNAEWRLRSVSYTAEYIFRDERDTREAIAKQMKATTALKWTILQKTDQNFILLSNSIMQKFQGTSIGTRRNYFMQKTNTKKFRDTVPLNVKIV